MSEVQVITTVMSADQENDPDILSINGAAALTLSQIPWDGPIGAVRVGYIDGEIVVNPTESDLAGSTLDMVVAGTSDAIMMVEGESDQVSEETLVAGIERAHDEIRRIVDLQLELQRQAGKEKWPFEPPAADERVESECGHFSVTGCAPRLITLTRFCDSRERPTCGRSFSPIWQRRAMKMAFLWSQRRSWMHSKRS